MAYLQLKSSDAWYYEQALQNGGVEAIRIKLGAPNWFDKIERIVPMPSVGDLGKYINDLSVCFLHPGDLEPASLFVLKQLPNTEEEGVKSKQQALYDEDINDALYNRFGMTVSNPPLNFSDLGGFEAPKREMLKRIDFVGRGFIQKNLSMFLGVSRSGKSFFAECLAGELGRRLIILDLGMIMCDSNPPRLLDSFFKYLETIGNYVLLIDEIEKAADPESSSSMAKVMIGKLLTIFNNFNSDSGFCIGDNPVIATANNITVLLNKNPEFINRFGLKYFVNYPSKESFVHVTNYYLKKATLGGTSGEELYNYLNMIYPRLEVPVMSVSESSLSGDLRYACYAAGEVKELVSALLDFSLEENGNLYVTEDIVQTVLRLQTPQLSYANRGVNATIEAARMANFREVR